MRKTLAGATLAAAFALSGPVSAITVFADFDGDMAYDPYYELTGSGSAVVYAQLTAAEDDAGGLLSFAAEGTLNPTSLVQVTGGSVATTWALGPEIEWDSDSVRAAGGTLGLLLAPKGLVELFTVDLTRIAPFGQTVLSFAAWHKSPTFDGWVLADVNFLHPIVDFQDSTIGPAVPIPAAAWLFGSALLGLAGIARKRKA